jgi:hypothetical protein
MWRVFYRVFIPILGVSFLFTQENFWGERLGFPFHFSGDFFFRSLAFPIRVL